MSKRIVSWQSAKTRRELRAYHAGLRASAIGKLELRDHDAKADRIMVHSFRIDVPTESRAIPEQRSLLS